ncbi:hypothetical protein [Nocardioides marinquilinus]|uniref:hypothetical protein n=1 Tax=Nocardioides marinquilinus TaxID=1210400 RepID=UPI0031F00247
MLRRLLPLLLSVPLALTLASPATAASWSSPDAAANVDGSEYGPIEPGECWTSTDVDATHRRDLDIRRLSVRHGRRDVVVTVRFADLVDGRRSSLELPMLTPRGDYTLDLDVTPRGRVRTSWVPGYQSAILEAAAEAAEEDPEGCQGFFFATEPGRCRGLEVERSPAADTVRVVVPRSCLGDPRAVRVGASTHGFEDDRDGETFRTFSDRWAPPGRDRGWFVYGPWVRAAA